MIPLRQFSQPHRPQPSICDRFGKFLAVWDGNRDTSFGNPVQNFCFFPKMTALPDGFGFEDVNANQLLGHTRHAALNSWARMSTGGILGVM